MLGESNDRSVVIGVDLGTQSVKVVLYDFKAKAELAHSRRNFDLIIGDDGAREQQASWWLEGLIACFADLPKEYKRRAVAIAVSGQQHGFVPLSADGRVLSSVKLWNDTSTLAECDEIEAKLGGRDAAIVLAGNPILPGYTASKVLWLKKNKPEAYDAMRHILLPHDFINFYLTGKVGTEAGDASGTGFFDVRRRQWSTEILSAIDCERDLSKSLPQILSPYQSIGHVAPLAAGKLGLQPDVLVAVGGGDNMMAAIGTGAVAPGALTVSLGTSGTIFAYSDQPAISENGDFAAFCSSTGGYLPLACSLNCTSATELMRSTLGLKMDDFESLLRSAEAGSAGVMALPFFSGERTPECPRGSGSFFGLNPLNTNPANLIRSVVEATAYSLRYGLDSMRSSGLTARIATVTGGGAHSPSWLQIIADVLNVEVKLAKHDEAAAFGAAMQALWCYQHAHGSASSLADTIGSHLEFGGQVLLRPNEERASLYTEAFRRYQDLVIMMQARWTN